MKLKFKIQPSLFMKNKMLVNNISKINKFIKFIFVFFYNWIIVCFKCIRFRLKVNTYLYYILPEVNTWKWPLGFFFSFKWILIIFKYLINEFFKDDKIVIYNDSIKFILLLLFNHSLNLIDLFFFILGKYIYTFKNTWL